MGDKLRSRSGMRTGLLAALMVLAGCAGLQPPDDGPALADRRPEPWSELETMAHLRGFNGRQTHGRRTGSAGFAQAAAYAEAMMAEFGLQPVTPESYRHIYFTPLNSATDARVARLGADTLIVTTGTQLVADPRSAAGSVRSSEVASVPLSPPGRAPRTVVVGPADTTGARLRALAASGVRAVIAAIRPTAGRSARPVDSLLIVQMDPEAIGRMGLPGAGTGRIEAMGADVLVEVAGGFEPAAGAVNVLGYVAGRDPYLANELVVVGAPLDGPGRLVGSTEPDTTHLGVAAAAVLESARVLARIAEEGRGPDRTVLFALWAGSLQSNSGARAWVANPGWPRDAVVDVVDVGGRAAAMFREAGFPVRTIGEAGQASRGGAPMARAADRAASLAHDILMTASSTVWYSGGASRVPARDVSTSEAAR